MHFGVARFYWRSSKNAKKRDFCKNGHFQMAVTLDQLKKKIFSNWRFEGIVEHFQTPGAKNLQVEMKNVGTHLKIGKFS